MADILCHFCYHSIVLKSAIEIVTTLQKAGHKAYFAGGCVRDMILKVEPKDYDIATSARPEEIEALFENNSCWKIIRRNFHTH